MTKNKYRAEALKIWRSIAEGLLNEQSDPPSLQHIEALDFLQGVAKNLVIADSMSSGSRADAIVSAVRLTGKVTKFEEDIFRMIVLIDEFFPNTPHVANRSRNSTVAHYMMKWAENADGSEFSEYILSQGYNELMKVVQQVRRKRLA